MTDTSVPSHMKALQLVEFNKNYKLNTIPVPKPGDGQILVRIHASSYCHTDYITYLGLTGATCPIIPGHEPAGKIAAIGPNVPDKWRVGQRVGIINFGKPCGECPSCRWYASTTEGTLDGRYCEHKTLAGIVGADGGLSEYMLVSDYCVFDLPDGLEYEQAGPLMCAGATVWNGLVQANLKPGNSVGIVGIGGLGVLGVQFARSQGYRTVAIDSHANGIELAESMVDLKPDLIANYTDAQTTERILEMTGRVGLDAVLVCTDDTVAAEWSLSVLRPLGTCILIGIPAEGYHFGHRDIILRQVVIKGLLHSSPLEVENMLRIANQHNIRSHLTKIKLEEAENLPERMAAHDFKGRLVVLLE